MNISTSIRKLASLFILFFVALSGALVYWQAMAAPTVIANEHNSRSCLQNNLPIRGNIYDRNGVPLAWSVSDPEVYCGYRRVYKDPSLAGLIGYYAGPGFPSTGIEKEFDTYLSGRAIPATVDSTLNQMLHRPPLGYDLYLTIDSRIQDLTEQDFDTPTKTGTEPKRGSIVVSNPHTGEILAMVSRPDYDPTRLVQTLLGGDLSYYNQLNTDPDQPLLFRPLWARYVPGSIYKTVTLAAALDSGSTTLTEQFNEQQAKGPIVVGGETFGPAGNNTEGRKTFPVTTEFAYAYSDNVILAQIGAKLGAEKWLDYNRRFYVEQSIPFDLPSAVSHVLPAGQTTLKTNQLAENAFGQGVDNVTPFQMSLIDNTVANNGILMRPMLVSKIALPQVSTDDPRPRINGEPFEQNPDSAQALRVFTPMELGQVLQPQTATEVRQAMYGVMFCNADFVRNWFWSSGASAVIGKTGTAEIGPTVDPHGWMLTQAPYDASQPEQLPAITIVSMKENSGNGADVNGPVLQRLYNNIFSQRYVQAPMPKLPPDLNYCTQKDLTTR